MAEIQTISAESLTRLTGLSDAMHRKLARLGYFPPPIEGQYQQTAAIVGAFKYYREIGAKKNGTLESEKVRKVRAEADLVTAKARAMERKHVPVDAVMLVWEKVMLNLRAKIMSSGLAEKDRRGILDELQPANLDEYFAGVVIDEGEGKDDGENIE